MGSTWHSRARLDLEGHRETETLAYLRGQIALASHLALSELAKIISGKTASQTSVGTPYRVIEAGCRASQLASFNEGSEMFRFSHMGYKAVVQQQTERVSPCAKYLCLAVARSAQRLGLPRWRLLYLIEKGVIPGPSRTLPGRRLFSEQDVKNAQDVLKQHQTAGSDSSRTRPRNEVPMANIQLRR